MTALTCLPCGGEGVIDTDPVVIVCPCCNGTQVLSPERIEYFGLTARYEHLARLEAEGASFLAAVGEASS